MEEIWNNPKYLYGSYMEAIDKLQLHKESKELILQWFLAQAKNWEQKNNYSVMEYKLQMRIKEVTEGIYGENQQQCFFKMSVESKKQAARYMLLQERAGESLQLYGKAVMALLKDGVLYKNRRKTSELLLYLGKARNTEEEAILEFANREFLPFGYTVLVYWQKSFGIIGDKRCMDLNEILLY